MFDFERVRPGDRFSAVMILIEAKKRVEADNNISRYCQGCVCNMLQRAIHHVRLQSTTVDVWEIIE